MGTHFSALGFKVESSEELDLLVRAVLEDSEAVRRTDGGVTHVRGTGSRAAVAVQLDVGGAVTCVAPFISPTKRQTAIFRGVSASPDCEHCTPIRVDLELSKDEKSAGMAAQVAFVTPHAIAWTGELVDGDRIEVGLGAIAEKIEVIAGDGTDFGIVALGMNDVPPQPRAEIKGKVTSHFLRHNELGGAAFEWASVDIGGVEIELVADPADLPAPFSNGQCVKGEVRLVGPVWTVLEGGDAADDAPTE